MIRDELAKKLKDYREAAGLTIYEVGKIIGKSGKTVSAWECGRGQPDADMLLTLCKVYGIESISDLYGICSPGPALSTSESTLLSGFRDLNEEGQEKVLSYVDDLIRAGIYKRSSESGMAQEA